MSKVTILTKPNRIVIASKGVQGPPGPEGPEGIQGIQGEKGDTGDVTPEAIAARDAAVEAASLAEQARLLGATIGFATKADMDASLAHPDGTLALVTNDATAANNGTYRKTGASGSGAWVQSADRVTGLEGRVSGIESEVSTLEDESDANFAALFSVNRFSADYYGTDAILPAAVASGTTFTPVSVGGVPAISMTTNPSSGAGGARYQFPASVAPSGEITVGVTIISSEASPGISRIQIVFRDVSGVPIETHTHNESFSGTTEPKTYLYTHDVPAGTVTIRFEILAYGTSGNPRTTVFSKLLLADGEVPAFFRPEVAGAGGGAGLPVVYLAPSGSDANAGTSANPMATLGAAISAVGGRGVVVVKSGSYDYSNFALDYTQVLDLTITGEARDLSDKRPIIRFGKKLAGITLESGKVYKADATSAGLSSGPNWIWHDDVPDAQTLVSSEDRHGLLRGRANRLPCTRIRKTTATVLEDAISEIQGASVPLCFYDTSTKMIYFSIAGGGNAEGESIYVASAGVDGAFGSHLTSSVPLIGTSGRLRLRNLEFRYMGVNLRTFVEWECFNVSVLGARLDNFVYAGNGAFEHCESMGAQGGHASGGDGFNSHDYAVAEMRNCYTHDNNDDGESAHENCYITAYGCVSEFNGSAGFIPASGGHGRYHDCISRSNGSRTAVGGFVVSGAPAAGDDGVGTSAECFRCISIGDATGFNSLGGQQLDAYDCIAVNPDLYGFSEVRTAGCFHSGTGTARSGGSVIALAPLA